MSSAVIADTGVWESLAIGAAAGLMVVISLVVICRRLFPETVSAPTARRSSEFEVLEFYNDLLPVSAPKLSRDGRGGGNPLVLRTAKVRYCRTGRVALVRVICAETSTVD